MTYVLSPLGRGDGSGPNVEVRQRHGMKLMKWRYPRTLLPLGRRCPVVSKTRFQHDGADEGAFTAGGNGCQTRKR